MTPEQVFVRGVWMTVPSEDDISWVRRVAALPLTGRDPAAGFPATSNPEHVSWGLYQVDDATGQTTRPLVGSHEIMLAMDPSGREMRPRRDAE